MTHTTTVTIDGRAVVVVSTRSPAQMARYAHLCALLCADRTDRADERSESDDDKWRWACLQRNQAYDDALLYNEQDGDDWRQIGY